MNEVTVASPFALGGAWNVRLLLSAAGVIAAGPAAGPLNWPSNATAVRVSNLISGLVIDIVTVWPSVGVGVEYVTSTVSMTGVVKMACVVGVNVSAGAPTEVTPVIVIGEATLGGGMKLIEEPSAARAVI